MFDLEGNVTSVNNVVLSYGYEKEAVIGKRLLEFIPEKSWPMISEHLADLAEGKSAQGEVELNTKKGTVIAEFRSSPVKKRGKIVGFQSIVRDITDRKNAEKALKESERKLRDVIDTSPDAIIWVDTTGKITLANKKVFEITGFSEKDIIGKNFLDVEALTQESKDKILKGFMKRIEGVDTPPYEVEVVAKNGEIIPAELSASLIYERGEIVGTQSIFRDLRERKRAEERLRESEERLRQFIEYAPDAIYINDLNGNFIDGNKQAEKMTGYKREEIIGKSMLEIGLLSEKYLPKAIETLEMNMRGQKFGPDEFELVRKDGSTVIVEISSFPVKSEGKVEVIGIARDITERKAMEEKLRESEERFRNLFESIQDPVGVYVGREGHLIDYNTAFKKLSGYTDEELKDKLFLDFVHSDDHVLVLEKYSTKYSEEELPLVYELRAVNKKGETIPLEISVSTYKKKGKVVGIEVIHRDISERKRAEEALRRSEEQARRLLEFQNKVIDTADVWVDLLDKEGNVTLWNRAAELISGYSREEVIGHKKIWEWLYPDPKYRAEIFAQAEKIIEKGGRAANDETTIRCKDGTLKTIRWYDNSILDEKGKPVGSIAVGIDITEKKAMERKLQEYAERLEEMVEQKTKELTDSEKKYRVLYETIRDGISTTDMDGRIIECNQAYADMLDYSKDELRKLTYQQLTPEQWHQMEANIIKEQVVKRGYSDEYEKEYIRKDGTVFPTSIRVGLIRGEDGKPKGMWGIARDITERKQMEAQLLKTERLAAIGELATMVGHDLRNPLSSLQNACYYLKMKLGASKDEKVKKMFEVVGNEINHANNIVKDLLDFSRVKKPDLKKVDLVSSIQDALAQLKFPENIKLTTKFSEVSTIEADPDQLRRVFQNITLNGIQAMPDGGELTVSARKNGDFVEAVITDTGVGIPEENMDKLFTPLFTTKAQGVGLGLAICKNLVEGHDGRIEVKSKVGEGSTVTVKLPIHQNKGGEKQS